MVPKLVVASLLATAPALASAQPDRALQVQLNVGLVAFPGDVDVSTGGAWGFNVALGPWDLVELELGYLGASYTERLGGGRNIVAVENGGYGAVKLAPVRGRVEPYLLGGFGISRVNVVDEPRAEGALQDETIAKVPVAIGLDLAIDRFAIGVRGTWAFLLNNQLAFQTESARGADQLLATFHLGARF
mgnify:CR=1 FL=1